MCGSFRRGGIPKMVGLEWKILLEWMIEGYPPLRETFMHVYNMTIYI